MREGVNKVALRLFEHNEKAYRAAVRMMEQYGKAAIVHPVSYTHLKKIMVHPQLPVCQPNSENDDKRRNSMENQNSSYSVQILSLIHI